MSQKELQSESKTSESSDKNVYYNVGDLIVGMSKAEILAQVDKEATMAEKGIQTKRQTFRDRLKLYNNQRKQRDKVAILTIYTTINTLMAVHYTDDISVEFSPREFGDSSLTDNINATAKFDQEEMGLDQINYYTQFDRFFYGVGLRDMSCFDTVTNTPIVKTISPLCWLPDPRGGIDANGEGGFRFYGFEVERTHEEMENNSAFFNIPEEDDGAKISTEMQQTKVMELEAHGLDQTFEEGYENKSHYQLDWFTTLKNEKGGYSKYLVTVSSDRKELYRIEKIKVVTEEEKQDESKVPWPLITNYYSPQRNNPFGVSVPDLVEDKQRAKSILANLRISTEKAALYPMYIYNTQAIRNRRDLDFGFNKAIAVNLPKDRPLSDVLLPVQKAQNRAGTFEQERSLDSEAQIATGADQMQAGVLSDSSRTYGEVRQVTLNAQTRFLLGYKVNAWGEKRFWQLWYRQYRQYFSKTQKKIIRLQGTFANKFTTITRKDFITVSDPDVQIVSKYDLETRRDKQKTSFGQIVPLILQDPTTPVASRNFAKRYLMKLNSIEPDVIEVLVPDSPDEMTAKIQNELLSRNMSAMIGINEDHLSHMVIHSYAEDTDAKFAHIEAHKKAYIMSGQKANTDKMMASAVKSSGNMVNQSLSQMNSQANNLNAGGQPLAMPNNQ